MSQPKTSRPWIAAVSVTAGAAILLLAVFGLYLYRAKAVAGGSSPDIEVMFLSTLATMLAILIAGAFIFTTFRMDAQAEHVATQAVQPAVVSANEAARRALDAEKKLLGAIDEASKAQLFAEADAFANLSVDQAAPPPSDTNGDP